MTRVLSSLMAAVLAVTFGASTVLAQNTLRQKIHYSISIPHAVEMGGFILPAGKYVIYQVNPDNQSLFALHAGDAMDSPIAIIHTTRIDFDTGEYPEDGDIVLDFESRPGAMPVLEGWVVPGMDGWEVIALDVRDEDLLVRAE